jgi:hypothetical protein
LRPVLAASALSLCLAATSSTRAAEATAPTAPTDVTATTPAAPAAKPGPRELGGHQFIASHLIEHPFSVTSFAQNFGVGAGEALGPRLDLSGSAPVALPDSKWYGYAGFVEQIDLTVRILDWLSVRGGFAAGLRQGAGNGSAIVVGTTANAAGVLGVKGSMQLAENVRGSLSLNAAYGPTLNLLLLQGLKQAAAAGKLSAGEFFNSRDALTTNLTAGTAWAPWRWLGVIGNLAYQHTRSATLADVDQNGILAAGTVEFDALPLVPWLPVGTGVTYRYTGPIGSGTGAVATEDEVSVGAYYTGRPNLVLGLEVEGRVGRIDTELKARQALAWINFRYYW